MLFIKSFNILSDVVHRLIRLCKNSLNLFNFWFSWAFGKCFLVCSLIICWGKSCSYQKSLTCWIKENRWFKRKVELKTFYRKDRISFGGFTAEFFYIKQSHISHRIIISSVTQWHDSITIAKFSFLSDFNVSSTLIVLNVCHIQALNCMALSPQWGFEWQ